MGDGGGGSLISLVGVAPCRIVGVFPFVIFHCAIKSRRFILALAHPGSPRKRALESCVSVCMCFDTVAWVTGSISGQQKSVQLIPKGSLPEQVQEENRG